MPQYAENTQLPLCAESRAFNGKSARHGTALTSRRGQISSAQARDNGKRRGGQLR
jgi:hypothetical protein